MILLIALPATTRSRPASLQTPSSALSSTNSFRAVRDRPILCAIFDEVAFWRDDASATPDIEIYNAVKPVDEQGGGALRLGGPRSRQRFRIPAGATLPSGAQNCFARRLLQM